MFNLCILHPVAPSLAQCVTTLAHPLPTQPQWPNYAAMLDQRMAMSTTRNVNMAYSNSKYIPRLQSLMGIDEMVQSLGKSRNNCRAGRSGDPRHQPGLASRTERPFSLPPFS